MAVLEASRLVWQGNDPSYDLLHILDKTGVPVAWISPNGSLGGNLANGSGGGSGTPGGSNGQIQFNNSNAFGGDTTFSWDNTAKQLNMAGSGLFMSGGGTLNHGQQALVNFYPPDDAPWAFFVGNASSGGKGFGLYTANDGQGIISDELFIANIIFYPAALGLHPARSVGISTTSDFWTACDFTPRVTGGYNLGNANFIWKQTWSLDGYFSNSVNAGVIPVYANSAYRFYGSELTSATNNYFLWYDSPGVFRVKGDGIMAYYNPSFTKYVPGATNFERIVQQWNTNVAEIGPEAGGTGTLRPLRLLGSNVIIPGSTPASASAGGIAGTVAWDASFVYVCIATNTWKRSAIATW